MKIAICKGGTNITFSSNNRSAANADILYTIKQIYDGSKRDNPEITIVTKKTRNTFIPKIFNVIEYDKVDFDDYDNIILFNFSINFFGGQDGGNLMGLYSKLSNSNTTIKYMFTDGQLPFKKLWPHIKDREFAKNRTESEFEIDENRITYISQGSDIMKTYAHISSIKHTYKPREIEYIDIARFILANYFCRDTRQIIFPKCFKNNDRKFVLGFGGVERNTYKRKLIEKFYTESYQMENGEIGKTLIFGKIKTVKGPHITNIGQVPFYNVLHQMSKCHCTVIIGDSFYEHNFLTLRYYEAILSGCIPLMYHKMSNVGSGNFCIPIKDREDIQYYIRNFIHCSDYELKNDIYDYIDCAYKFDEERQRLLRIID